MVRDTAICLMGPTAVGKTELALRLAAELPVDIISVDSALVYRGMDIGTAKPGADILARVPHRLIDIRDPEQTYSAGDFVRDAGMEIERTLRSGRLPLLVGGTMMYFRALTRGIAELPAADAGIRAAIDADAAARGWPALHAELAGIDAPAARRIDPHDSQRIQRALEVHRASGKTLTEWQAAAPAPAPCRFVKLALVPGSRRELHARIRRRLESMLERGFVDEVARLRQRPGLSAGNPSMRAVGYRQMWSHLDGAVSLEEASSKALHATRQLAKRQLTWLRAEPGLPVFDPLEADVFASMMRFVQGRLDEFPRIDDNLL